MQWPPTHSCIGETSNSTLRSLKYLMLVKSIPSSFAYVWNSIQVCWWLPCIEDMLVRHGVLVATLKMLIWALRAAPGRSESIPWIILSHNSAANARHLPQTGRAVGSCRTRQWSTCPVQSLPICYVHYPIKLAVTSHSFIDRPFGREPEFDSYIPLLQMVMALVIWQINLMSTWSPLISWC